MPGPDSESALSTKLKIPEWALYLGQIFPAAATTVIQLYDGEASTTNCLIIGT